MGLTKIDKKNILRYLFICTFLDNWTCRFKIYWLLFLYLWICTFL